MLWNKENIESAIATNQGLNPAEAIIPINISFTAAKLADLNKDRETKELEPLIANNSTGTGFNFHVEVDFSETDAFKTQAGLGLISPRMAENIISGVSYDSTIKEAAKALWKDGNPTQDELDEAAQNALDGKGSRRSSAKVTPEMVAEIMALKPDLLDKEGNPDIKLMDKRMKELKNLSAFPAVQRAKWTKNLVGDELYQEWKLDQTAEFNQAVLDQVEEIQRQNSALV